jgi:hypothetical protein
VTSGLYDLHDRGEQVGLVSELVVQRTARQPAAWTISVPTPTYRRRCLAWAVDDKFFPLEHAERVAAILPNARVETIEHSRTWACSTGRSARLGSSATSSGSPF